MVTLNPFKWFAKAEERLPDAARLAYSIPDPAKPKANPVDVLLLCLGRADPLKGLTTIAAWLAHYPDATLTEEQVSSVKSMVSCVYGDDRKVPALLAPRLAIECRCGNRANTKFCAKCGEQLKK